MHDDKELKERVGFLHRTLQTDVVVEQFLEGREFTVSILGNERLEAFPIWELWFDKLPEGNTLRDWPIDYGDLEPYYDAFDYDIGSSGKAGNLQGRRIAGGNIFEAPRSRDYPNPPLAANRHGEMFGRAGDELGLHPFAQPSGILSRAWVNTFGQPRSACLYCGFCTRYGCEVDAKSSPVNTHLPVALDSGNYEIRTDSVVQRVELDSSGRATGVTYVDARGQEHFQPAETVLLTAFMLENVRLLLLSRGGRHPDGIGNAGHWCHFTQRAC